MSPLPCLGTMHHGISKAGIAGILLLLELNTSRAGDPSLGPEFLSVVRGYADVMIDKGRDRYGPVKTPLLLSALDRATFEPLEVRPAPPDGIRRGDRPGRAWSAMQGANPMLDQNLLRVFYTLSELTGDPHYAQAADAELRWFFENTLSPATHLLPWGEHLCWDTGLDAPVSGGTEMMHEFARPWVLWDRCFALAPDPSRQFALGLWEHQIANHKTGAYDRHAPYDKHGPRDGRDFPRHGGFYIGTWSQAWNHTHDPVFLEAIEAVLARFERKRVQPDGSKIATIGPLDLEPASNLVPEPLAFRLQSFAATEDDLIIPELEKQIAGRTLPRWQNGYSAGTLAGQAMFCLERFTQTGRPEYRRLLLAVADLYRGSRPEEDVDAWPLSFAHAISTEAAAYRWTRTETYRNEARRLARLAVDLYWQDNPLPRASLHTGHYETITGADSLALALLEVHAISHGLTNAIPRNTIDR
jgi:Periplasmic pectate lyase